MQFVFSEPILSEETGQTANYTYPNGTLFLESAVFIVTFGKTINTFAKFINTFGISINVFGECINIFSKFINKVGKIINIFDKFIDKTSFY